jgi:hypothetical protein
MRAFPLKYFVIAFAFTWFFWGLQLLGARGAIPILRGLRRSAPSALWWPPW